jgi:hypothetical protein
VLSCAGKRLQFKGGLDRHGCEASIKCFPGSCSEVKRYDWFIQYSGREGRYFGGGRPTS